MDVNGWYLYGIVRFPPPLARAVRGLGGEPVSLVPHEGVAAVVSPSPLGPWPVVEAHLNIHEEVVENVMAYRPILPSRFNTIFRTEGEIRRILRERAQAFSSALDRVAGKVEMGLRVLWAAPAEAPAARIGEADARADETLAEEYPGTSYLYRRLAEQQLGSALRAVGEPIVGQLHARFRSLAVESRLRRFTTRRLLLTAAYLMKGDGIKAFQEAVARAQENFPDLSFLLTGPWPPYHFVDGLDAVRPGSNEEKSA